LAIIFKNPDSFEIIRKIGSHLENPDSFKSSGKLAVIPKDPDIFEIIRKIGNHLDCFESIGTV